MISSVDATARTPRETSPGQRRAALRAPLAAASIVTTAAHVPVTAEHLNEAFYIGVLFIALEAASVVLAVLLLVRPARFVFPAVSIVGGLAVVAFVASRTVGLPLIGDDIGNWTEPLAVVSVVAETIMIVGGAMASRRHAVRRGLTTTGLLAGALVLAAGLVATGYAAVAEQHEGPDSMPGMDMSLSAPTAS